MTEQHVNEMSGENLRLAVTEEIEAAGLSRADVAKESGVGSSVLSLWMGGKYSGDNAKVEAELRRWLSYRASKSQAQLTMPRAPEWVEAPTSARITAALSYAQMAADLVVVYGGAGVGKSKAIERYRDTCPNVFVVEATPTTGTVGGLLRCLVHTLGLRLPSGHSDAMELAVRERLRGTDGLLIIDEAQFLNDRALEICRRITELCGVGLAFVGNETVYAQLTGRNRAASFAQLFSRVGKRVRLGRPTAQDVDALLRGWGIQGKAEADLIHDIAGKPGALRGVNKTLRLATMFATGKGEPLGLPHIRAAWRDLGAEQ